MLIFLVSCSEQEQTPEQKAAATLKDHLANKTGSDYQAVQTRLDSFYATYISTAEGSKLQNEYNSVHAENKDIYSPNALFLTHRETALQDTIKARTARFGQKFCGWKAIHSYKFKNEQGVATEATDTFLLNKDYQLMSTDTLSL
jgi:hypothetical protein